MPKPVLYSGTRNASSWAMRAWLALREAGFEFSEDVVDIRRPQRYANLARIGRFSPSATVPALVIGEAVIFDSMAIMEFANDASGGALLPKDPLQSARARSLLAWQHSGLSAICARISFESAFYPHKRALTETEIAECDRLFALLEDLLTEYADAAHPYLFGPLSLADLALVPAVVRLTRHRVPLERYEQTARWAEALLARDSVRLWMDEADRLPHIWYEDYLIPGAPLEASSPGRGAVP